jgi:glycosyltransferase involved in cell wall biosynthesis
METTAHEIIAIVALPPPTHGRALVNQGVVGALSAARVPFKVINTSPGSLRRGPSYHARRIASYVSKAVPAIVVAQGGVVYTAIEPGPGIWYNFIVILFARIKGLRIVLHHHSALYTKAFEYRFDWLSRLAGRKAVHVVLDEFMAKDIKATYSSIGRVAISHNAFHVAQPAMLEHSARRLTCGFMSNLSREKGLDVFLECLRAACGVGLNLQAILAGPPVSLEAENTISGARREFGGMLHVLGPVADSRKEEFFRSIDVFLFPTFYKIEAQPLVILEAMSYGIPVVTSQQGYCDELVGEAGASTSIADFERVAISFVTRCYENAEYLSKMRVKARKRFELLKAEADVQMNDLIRLLGARDP